MLNGRELCWWRLRVLRWGHWGWIASIGDCAPTGAPEERSNIIRAQIDEYQSVENERNDVRVTPENQTH